MEVIEARGGADVDEDVRNSLEREQSENDSKTSRKAKIALAATVGGGLLALTGGLIAVPALAAALTSAAATGTIGAGFLTTAAAMAGELFRTRAHVQTRSLSTYEIKR